MAGVTMNKEKWRSIPLDSVSLIEASAGTGKTHLICYLYLRLLLEKKLDLSRQRVLVVTFTNAAAAELRLRIRKLIADAVRELEGESSSAELADYLRSLNEDKEELLRLLRLALWSFDEAAVYTLHGFCHRVLLEHAFESNQPLVGGDKVMDMTGMEVARDYCRLLYQANDDVIASLEELSQPESLVRNAVLSSCLIHPDLPTRPLMDVDLSVWPQPLEDVLAQPAMEYRSCWEQTRNLWNRVEIEECLLSDDMNKSSYKEINVKKALDALEDLFSGVPVPGQLVDKFDLFTTKKINAGTKKNKAPPEHVFFSSCDRLKDAADKCLQARTLCQSLWRCGWLQYARDETEQRSRMKGTVSYNDMLLRLFNALRDGEQGKTLAASLCRRFPGRFGR